jgi:MYXO-CTERM domain-containing protein
VGAGESAYDATMKDMARVHNSVVAAGIGQGLFYPTQYVEFEGAAWPIAPVFTPLALGLLGMGLVYALRRRRRTRQPERRMPLAA